MSTRKRKTKAEVGTTKKQVNAGYEKFLEKHPELRPKSRRSRWNAFPFGKRSEGK